MGLTKPRAAQIYNLDYKQSTRVVTVANVTLSGGAPATVDGVTLSLNDRILVTAQSTASQNGLYYVTTVGSGSNGTWARTSDGNETGEIEAGMIVMVTAGTIYADTQWKLTTDDPITVGSTALTFVQNYSANSISSGTSNVVVNSNANVTVSSAGTANVLTISSTGTVTSGTGSVTGNITGGNITTAGLITATGNVTGGNILTAGIMSSTGNGIHGNILTSGLVSSTGNIITAGNISAVGTIYSNGAVNGTAFAVGNSAISNVALGMFPTAGQSGEYAIRDYSTVFSHIYFDVGIGGTANGAFQFRSSNAFRQLANINSIGVTTPLAVSATGNITGNYFIGNGSQLTGIVASGGAAITNGTSNVVVAASGNVTVGVAGTAAVATFYTAGITANSVATTNNGNAFNFKVGDDAWLGDVNTADTIGIRGQQNAANAYIVFGNADNIQLGRAGSGPLTYGGAFSATGNITGGNILGGANVNATTHTGTTVSVTANVTGGNVLTGGLISATGNITGNFIIGNGSQLTGLPAGYSNANVATFLAAFGSNTISTSGNITGGNLIQGTTRVIKWTTVANTAPTNAVPGDFWYNSYSNVKYQYTNDGTGNFWVDQSAPTSFTTITVGNVVNASANGVGNIGSAGGYFNTAFIKATSAQYADLAEMYVADQPYSAGTVVEFGGNFEITASTQTHSTRTAGVISTNPSYLMNSAQLGEHVLPVALTGRVPCHVVGTVSKGDRLVASSIAGVATRLNKNLYEPGSIIGKALEDYDSNDVGIIEIAVGRY
jgi:hypothetical protein